jgi:hypothetical protein
MPPFTEYFYCLSCCGSTFASGTKMPPSDRQSTLLRFIIPDATAHLFEFTLKHEGPVMQDLAPVTGLTGIVTPA